MKLKDLNITNDKFPQLKPHETIDNILHEYHKEFFNLCVDNNNNYENKLLE